MRLLVSVRDGEEVAAALAGGADIVDAKEPTHGALGPVGAEMLSAIAARVPETVPFSVALGDFTSPESAARGVLLAPIPARRAPSYVKLGFAGQPSASAAMSLLTAALEAAAVVPARPIVVAVAYADHVHADAPAPEALLRATLAAGAGGFLIDTCIKDGKGLLDWLDLERLSAIAAAARSAGLLLAIAGSLDLDSIGRVAGMADVVGVRGAACRGGREGSMDAALVGRLRERLLAGSPPGPGPVPPTGRTRGPDGLSAYPRASKRPP